MVVVLRPSQVEHSTTAPLPYTASPLKLLVADVILCLSYIRYLPGVFLPLRPCDSGDLDELYPSWENLTALAIHGFLIVYQVAFILSLPVLFFFPLCICVLYIAVVFIVNSRICAYLNGRHRILMSQVPVSSSGHESEHWIYINGVAAGRHWLQQNIDRLALTFGRRITGIHNRTAGIIFDVVECLIQRCFCYATEDVRDAYDAVKEALLNEKNNKVVLILHSQGGIEGGLIIDWLFDIFDEKTLSKLEIYTFGNAANHWNNPPRKCTTDQNRPQRCIPHIEHYVNSGDFVAMWGILNFIKVPNRYFGDVFNRHGSGHFLNQHYLDTMFPLSQGQGSVSENNEFLEQSVKSVSCGSLVSKAIAEEGLGQIEADADASRMKDYSRLWRYRNGSCPED